MLHLPMRWQRREKEIANARIRLLHLAWVMSPWRCQVRMSVRLIPRSPFPPPLFAAVGVGERVDGNSRKEQDSADQHRRGGTEFRESLHLCVLPELAKQ